jgi:hypothetical protein
MKKFIVLFMAPAEAMKQMSNATPEEQQKIMQEWMGWMDKYQTHFVDTGAPAGKNTRVGKQSSEEVSNEVSGYSIMQSESKEELIKILQENDHFALPGAYVEVMDWIEL